MRRSEILDNLNALARATMHEPDLWERALILKADMLAELNKAGPKSTLFYGYFAIMRQALGRKANIDDLRREIICLQRDECDRCGPGESLHEGSPHCLRVAERGRGPLDRSIASGGVIAHCECSNCAGR